MGMPSSAIRTFTDPDMYFAGIRNRQIDGVITKRGEFRAESTRIDLHCLWMHRIDESLPRIMRITPSGKRSLILFATDPYQPEMQVSGIEISEAQIAMFGLDWPYYLRSSAACGWGTMSLMPEDLAAISEAIIGRPLTPPSFPRWTTARLLQLHEAAGHRATTAPDILAKAEVAQAIEEALLQVMVLSMSEGHLDAVRNVHRHRARVMRRLEEVLTSTPDRPLYMPQLCATVGASYTMLRGCCQDYLGMSPKRYLWLRRMHLVRRALRITDAEKTTVTEIATDYGFWELGRFAVAYRSLFGEAPSVALRRPPKTPNRRKSSSRHGNLLNLHRHRDRATYPYFFAKMPGRHCGSSVLQRDECREAARAPSSNPITSRRTCVRHKSKSSLP
jgi:AraC-like DNA-binding protein